MPQSESAPSQESKQKSLLDRFLSIFAEVRPGEGATALILLLNVLLLLVAYYVLKTVREPLILSSGGAEMKGYATAAQAVLLIVAIPAYSALANRMPRMKLITSTLVFYAVSFVLFWVMSLLKVPYLGFAFFLFLGIFSLSVIAQFWSMANDLYTPEQGKRLFAILGIGASVGAVAGSYVASLLVKPLGPFQMMLVASVLLMGCLGLSWLANSREEGNRAEPNDESETKKDEPKKEGGKNGFALILSDRYLLLVAGIIVLLNFINTTGELILDQLLTEQARSQFAPDLTLAQYLEQTSVEGPVQKEFEGFIGQWRGNFFTWVNAAGALTQMFLVSRIFKYIGIRGALFSLPLIAMFAYGVAAFVPVLALVRIGKIAENACDYSLYNTTKQALWLPTTREQKYNAKMAIDTFVVRAGDFVSGIAIAVFIGVFGAQGFAYVNLALIVVWGFVAWRAGKVNKERIDALEAQEPAAA